MAPELSTFFCTSYEWFRSLNLYNLSFGLACITSVLVSGFVNLAILEYLNLMDFSGTPKSTPKKCGCHGMILNSFGHKKNRKA